MHCALPHHQDKRYSKDDGKERQEQCCSLREVHSSQPSSSRRPCDSVRSILLHSQSHTVIREFIEVCRCGFPRRHRGIVCTIRLRVSLLVFKLHGQHYHTGLIGVRGICRFSFSKLLSVTVEPSDG